jgi:5'-nucleotidase
MKKRPHILITNDDGIHAPGLQALCRAAGQVADLTVVAPALEQSAVGLGITIRHPLHINKVDLISKHNAWSVTGTPADCVKLAMNAILDSPPDLILSGINRGTNAGRNLLYSGTVAAIIEGTLNQIPGAALSLADFHSPFDSVESYIPDIITYLLAHPMPTGTFLNINFPSPSLGKIKGFRFTNQGKEYWKENPEKRQKPYEETLSYYWLGAKLPEFDEEEDCDISWLRKGYAAAVPIYIDNLTDLKHLATQKQIFEKLIGVNHD